MTLMRILWTDTILRKGTEGKVYQHRCDDFMNGVLHFSAVHFYSVCFDDIRREGLPVTINVAKDVA